MKKKKTKKKRKNKTKQILKTINIYYKSLSKCFIPKSVRKSMEKIFLHWILNPFIQPSHATFFIFFPCVSNSLPWHSISIYIVYKNICNCLCMYVCMLLFFFSYYCQPFWIYILTFVFYLFFFFRWLSL